MTMEKQQSLEHQKGFQIQNSRSEIDAVVQSSKCLPCVIPAEAGIQAFLVGMDSRLRGSDGFVTLCESIKIQCPQFRIRSKGKLLTQELRIRSLQAGSACIGTIPYRFQPSCSLIHAAKTGSMYTPVVGPY